MQSNFTKSMKFRFLDLFFHDKPVALRYRPPACCRIRLATVLGLLCLTLAGKAHAQFGYTLVGFTAAVTGYNGGDESVVIPNALNGWPVTAIANFAFGSSSSFTNITIPDGITSIGDFTFQSCTNLVSATIGKGVTSIGVWPFHNCTNLTSITVSADNPAYRSFNGVLFDRNMATLVQFPGGLGGDYLIPDGVAKIGDTAFSACPKLTNVIIPDSVVIIGGDAFSYCPNLMNTVIPTNVTSIGAFGFAYTAMTSVTVPDSVTNIGAAAFQFCTHLTNITIGTNVAAIGEQAFQSDTNLLGIYFLGDAPKPTGIFFGDTNMTVYYALGTHGWGASFDGRPTVGVTAAPQFAVVTNNGSLTLKAYLGNDGTVVVPGVIYGWPVTAIGEGAFANHPGLTNITILNGVITIGSGAFANNPNLTNVTLPSSLIGLGNGAFADDPRLLTVNFSGNALATANDASVFAGSPQATVYYPAGTTGWGPTFDSIPTAGVTALSEFNFTTNRNAITITAYMGTNSTVFVPGAINGFPVTTIGSGAFMSRLELANITLPNGLTNIGLQAFSSCTNLKSVLLPPGLTTIGLGAFQYCTSLTNVLIPAGVTNLGGSVFANDPSLRGVYFQGKPPVATTNLFSKSTNATAYYLAGTTGWGATYEGVPTAVYSPTPPTIQNLTRLPRLSVLAAIGTPGAIYRTQRSTDLTTWVNVATNTTSAGGGIGLTDSFGDLGGIPPTAAFYRLQP